MFEVKNPYEMRAGKVWEECVEACRQEHDREMRELFEEINLIEVLNDNYDTSEKGNLYFRRSTLNHIRGLKEKFGQLFKDNEKPEPDENIADRTKLDEWGSAKGLPKGWRSRTLKG